MNTTEKGIVTLLRCAITGQALPLPEGFQLADALPVIRSHSLVTLAYEGAVRCGLDRTSPQMQTLFQSYCKLMLQSERQMQALDQLFDAFQTHGIDFLPMKGCNMKALYPRPELRLMGDADVLIRVEQYRDRIVPLMEELGYTFEVESPCDMTWDKKELHLELHKFPSSPINKSSYAYFADGWHLAHPEEGRRYAMAPEDEYLHLFAHFAKHFRGNGIGCRHVVDLWVYLRSHPELEKERLDAGLSCMGLEAFYRSTCILMKGWFEDGPMDEQTEQMSRYIFSSGNWGREDLTVVNEALLNSGEAGGLAGGRFSYMLRHTFPDLVRMSSLYPVLKKAPWLLPAAWIYRIVNNTLIRRHKLTALLHRTKAISGEALDERRLFLRSVGLDERQA